jgi:hypothetical protein
MEDAGNRNMPTLAVLRLDVGVLFRIVGGLDVDDAGR